MPFILYFKLYPKPNFIGNYKTLILTSSHLWKYIFFFYKSRAEVRILSPVIYNKYYINTPPEQKHLPSSSSVLVFFLPCASADIFFFKLLKKKKAFVSSYCVRSFMNYEWMRFWRFCVEDHSGHSVREWKRSCGSLLA